LYLVLDREGDVMGCLECRKAQVSAQLDKSERSRGDSPRVSGGRLVRLPSLLESGNFCNLIGARLLSTNLVIADASGSSSLLSN